MTTSGIVFNIQKFSVHDGPGIRTIVFLKGCPLRCQWCSNPEGLDRHPEIAINLKKCLTTVHCRRCVDICPQNAIDIDESTHMVDINRDRCDLCGECVKCCPSKAVNIFGKPMGVEAVMNTVEQDDLFYASSGGGLTLGGGEPLFQPGFARALLREAQSYGFETAIETSGHASWSDVDAVLQYCDFVLYDIKCMNSKKHKAFTGVSNERILANLENACRSFKDLPICIRTPIIPGFNDTEGDVTQIISFLKKLPGKIEYELLPYHQFGENKYSMLGKDMQRSCFEKIDLSHFEALNKTVQNGGL